MAVGAKGVISVLSNACTCPIDCASGGHPTLGFNRKVLTFCCLYLLSPGQGARYHSPVSGWRLRRCSQGASGERTSMSLSLYWSSREQCTDSLYCTIVDLLRQGALLGVQPAAREEGAGVHGQVLARRARPAGELLGGNGRGAQEAHDRAQDAVTRIDPLGYCIGS